MSAKASNRRRNPQQARSRTTVNAIMEAAAQILEASGPRDATTNAIAARAGVSIGTLYQYFPNKQALFTELARRFIADLGEATEQSLRTLGQGSVEEAVPRFMSNIGQLHAASPRLRSFLFQLPGSTPLMEQFNARLEDVVAQVLAQRPELGDRDPRLTAQVVVRAVDGVLRDTTLREPERIHDPALARELTRLVLGYLQA